MCTRHRLLLSVQGKLCWTLEIYSKRLAFRGLYKGMQDEYLGQLLNSNFLFVTL